MTFLGWLPVQLDLTTIVLFLAVLLLGRMLLAKPKMNRTKMLPPFPAIAFPILGHLPYIRKDPRGTLSKWASQHNGMFSLYFGSKLVIVVSSYEIAKEMFVKQADIFSDRPPNHIFRGENAGILSASGHVWEEQRSVVNVILRRFGMGKKVLADKIQEEVNSYLNELGKLHGEAQEVRVLTSTSISNNICSIIFGKRFEYDDPEFKEIIYTLQDAFRLTASSALVMYIPYLKYLPGDLFKQKRAIEVANTFRYQLCDEYIKKSTVQVENSDEDSDFITAYLREKKQREKKRTITTMDDLNLRGCVSSLFVAGSETTATAILWFMVFMLHHPNIQEKVYQEILKVVGHDRVPSMDDKPEMHYLNACIKETLRRASILPLNVVHMNNADARIKGYFIPKGTRIIAHLDSILLNEDIWEDPLQFRPDRFLDEEGRVVKREEFIPFSMGRRICLGEPLAKMELFLYLSTMLQRFQLQPFDPEHLPSLEGEYGVTCPPAPFKLRFVERSD